MSLVNVRLFLCIEFQHHEDIVTELLSNNWKNKILDCSCSFFRLIFSAKPFVFWHWVYFKKVWSETQCLFVVDVASRRHKFVLCPSIPDVKWHDVYRIRFHNTVNVSIPYQVPALYLISASRSDVVDRFKL